MQIRAEETSWYRSFVFDVHVCQWYETPHEVLLLIIYASSECPRITQSRQSPHYSYSKTCVKRPISKYQKLVFKTNYRLMQFESTAECSKGSILQYFQPSLSYQLSLRPSFCLFLSGYLHRFYCTYKHGTKGKTQAKLI